MDLYYITDYITYYIFTMYLIYVGLRLIYIRYTEIKKYNENKDML